MVNKQEFAIEQRRLALANAYLFTKIVALVLLLFLCINDLPFKLTVNVDGCDGFSGNM